MVPCGSALLRSTPQCIIQVIDLDTSTPDPVVTTTDLGDLPKATLRNTLRQTIFIAVVLVLALGAILLLGESQEPLHSALDRHEYDEAIRLIRLGANVNAVSANGEVPLVLASDNASADAYDVVRELLRVGARVDETDSEGNTALHQAAFHGNLAVVDLLMRNGADVNASRDVAHASGEWSETPLAVAYTMGHFRVGEFLTSMGAKVPGNLATLKSAGEYKRRLDFHSDIPKPDNISEDEWIKVGVRNALREVHPQIAQWMEDIERMNPEAMSTIEGMLTAPPEGTDEVQWTNLQFVKIQQMIQSGQLVLEIPKLKK